MTITINSKQILKKNPGFVPRNIAGELVLIPVQQELRKVNSIYTLNPMGASIWELVDGQKTYSDIRDNLLQQYNVTENQLDKDLEELIGQLIEIQALIEA